MPKKGNAVKWYKVARSTFYQIKKALGKAIVLVSLDYTKEFMTFPFSSKYIIVVVLLQ